MNILNGTIILRLIYVFIVPALVVGIGVESASMFFHAIFPEDPLRTKITKIASEYATGNFRGQQLPPMTLFNGYFFVACKPIAAGDVIEAASLEREAYAFKGPPGPGMILSKQTVVHSRAAKNIASDQLVVAADLTSAKNLEPGQEHLDDGVKTAGAEREMTTPWMVLAGIVLGAGVILFGYGSIALLVVAFKKSLFWGLGSLLIPFVASVFKLKHWKATHMFFRFSVVGAALMSFGVTLFLLFFKTPLYW